LHRIGKPAQRVAEGAHGELDQNIAIPRGTIVGEEALAILPDLEPEADEIALGAVDPPRLQLSLEQDVAGIEIGQAYPPWRVTFRQHQPAAIIEIEAQSLWATLGGNICRRGIWALFGSWRGTGRRRSRLSLIIRGRANRWGRDLRNGRRRAGARDI